MGGFCGIDRSRVVARRGMAHGFGVWSRVVAVARVCARDGGNGGVSQRFDARFE